MGRRLFNNAMHHAYWTCLRSNLKSTSRFSISEFSGYDCRKLNVTNKYQDERRLSSCHATVMFLIHPVYYHNPIENYQNSSLWCRCGESNLSKITPVSFGENLIVLYLKVALFLCNEEQNYVAAWENTL